MVGLLLLCQNAAADVVVQVELLMYALLTGGGAVAKNHADCVAVLLYV